MTAPDAGGSAEVCACGHSLKRHLRVMGQYGDPCAGGTPGFCGCRGYHLTATPVHDPGLDHLLEEVAAEVLRQDAAGGMSYTRDGEWLANRTYSVQRAAHAIRSMRAIDMAAGGTE